MSRSSTTTDALPNPHPGEILLEEFLKPMGLSQTALARAVGVAPRRINEIVLGKRAISADTAVRLARYFDNEPLDWMRMQAEFDIARATRNLGAQIRNIRKPGENERTYQQTAAMSVITQNKNIRRRILR
jgi:addiction module HigA family antidote